MATSSDQPTVSEEDFSLCTESTCSGPGDISALEDLSLLQFSLHLEPQSVKGEQNIMQQLLNLIEELKLEKSRLTGMTSTAKFDTK